ncbi:tetratricopeptide repeat protein [Chitiniphilus eburneus]|uniref:Tetratricopeptide repeat protein n=1 Tax=Chitiniphilus eburneus TaxID=2571148 RepID=A0A4U0PWT6_9NEIS|nr:tetratricopeptide repeat protein [Chitiniphilus eburneus]TJZ72989.1 tetratricopeptide repeat protein [Chitiniphilus eburneus]
MSTPLDSFLAELRPLAIAAANGSPEPPADAADLLARARRFGDPGVTACALVTLGHAHQHIGALDEAQAAFRAAAPLYAQAGDDRACTEAQVELGYSHYAAGEYPRALAAWLDSLEQVRARRDLHHGTRIYLGVGKVYYALEDFTSALRYHELALQLVRGLDTPKLCCEVLINIAGDAYRMQHFDRALRALAEAGELLAGAVSNHVWEAEVESYLGLIHFARGEYPAAREKLDSAFAIHQENQNLWGKSHVLLALGRTHARLGELSRAEACLTSADELAGQARLTSVSREAAALLADLAIRRGDHAAALRHYKHVHALAAGDETVPPALHLGRQVGERLRQAVLRLRMENARRRLAGQPGGLAAQNRESANSP